MLFFILVSVSGEFKDNCWESKIGVCGSAGWTLCYCVISAISALGALFLTDWTPFLQLSFDSYASPDDAMISPFAAFSLHLNFPAESLYISNFGIADKTITFG